MLLQLLLLNVSHQGLIDEVRNVLLRVDNDLFDLISAELIDEDLLRWLEVVVFARRCLAMRRDVDQFGPQAMAGLSMRMVMLVTTRELFLLMRVAGLRSGRPFTAL